jgi:hypothetical protein
MLRRGYVEEIYISAEQVPSEGTGHERLCSV